MANLLKDFMHQKIIARTEQGFWLRDFYIQKGRLGRVVDIVADDTLLLVDFGTGWLVARIPTTSKLISLHTLDEISQAELRKQRWRYRLWRLRVFFRLAKKTHMYDKREK